MDTLTLFLEDRHGRRVGGRAVRVRLQLSGWRLLPDGSRQLCLDRLERRIVTDSQGRARVGLGFAFEGDWRASLSAGEPELLALRQDEKTLTVFEPPDRLLPDGTPLWEPTRGKNGPAALVLMGFDASNRFTATQLHQLMSPATDQLRALGGSVAVLRFPDTHRTPQQLAPRAAAAIRALAAETRGPVHLVGASTGGLIARVALADSTLPVRTLLTFDTPHRGANLSPDLQALIRRYGGPAMIAPLESPLARLILRDYATRIHWGKRGLAAWPQRIETRPFPSLGLPPWPRWCRTVAVSNGSRTESNHAQHLLRLWQPLRQDLVLARPEDRAPGSLLSGLAGFATALPLGIAGAEIRDLPTFIPTESALDAAPGEAPPVDAFHCQPPGAPALLHDQLTEETARFLLSQILRSA